MVIVHGMEIGGGWISLGSSFALQEFDRNGANSNNTDSKGLIKLKYNFSSNNICIYYLRIAILVFFISNPPQFSYKDMEIPQSN